MADATGLGDGVVWRTTLWFAVFGRNERGVQGGRLAPDESALRITSNWVEPLQHHLECPVGLTW